MTSRAAALALALALATTRPAAAAQPDATPSARKLARVGILGYGVEPAYIETLRTSLRELGWVEGRNIVFENRWSEAPVAEVSARVAELIRSKVDVIVANGTPSVRAAKEATTTVPVVMVYIGADPVWAGLVPSLSHPGGNVTGVAALGTELWAKRLQLFRQLVPNISRVVYLSNPANPGNVFGAKEFGPVAAAAGLALTHAHASDEGQLSRALDEIVAQAPGAVVCAWDPFLQSHARTITDFLLRHRLAVLAPIKEYVVGGALLSYGAKLPDEYRRAATYVDKILKGAKPRDLPIEQPLAFELVINGKTAKALGLTIPPELLVLADRVIE